MAFIHSLMEYCSPLWADASVSHLAQLVAKETKAFKINGMKLWAYEAESAYHFHIADRLVVWSFCLLPPLGPAPSALSMLCTPQGFAGCTRSISNPQLVKLPKSRIQGSLLSSTLSFLVFFCL